MYRLSDSNLYTRIAGSSNVYMDLGLSEWIEVYSNPLNVQPGIQPLLYEV